MNFENIRHLNKQEKRNAVSSLAYDIRVREKGDLFVAVITELGIISSASSIEEAVGKAIKQKDEYLKEIVENECEDTIQYPNYTSLAPKERLQLKLFAIKTALVGFTGIVTTAICAFIFVGILNSTIERNVNRLNHADAVIEKALNPLSEEKKQERLIRFRNNLEKIRPYIQEIKKAFSSTARPI